MSAEPEQTTAELLALMAPDPKSALDDERIKREKPHWCVCFLPLDLRGREVGLNGVLPAGLPFLFRSRSYRHRSDSLEDGADFWAVSTQYARDAVNSLGMVYAEHGFTIMHDLAGKDSESDKRAIARTIAKHLPHWRDFDDAPDPDFNLFDRRDAHLRRALATEEPESIPAKVLGYLIEANTKAKGFMRRVAGSVLAEAEAGRKVNGIGRTRPDDFELSALKWVGLQPSKHFDGYGDGSQAQPGTAELAEAINLMREAFVNQEAQGGNDEEIEAIKAIVREQQKQIASLMAKVEKSGKKE